MGEHESQAGRARVRGRQLAGNPAVLSGTDPGADPGAAEGGGSAPPSGSRSSTSAKPDFRAAVGRRLSEERELGPQVLSLISAAPPATRGSDISPAVGPLSRVDQRDEFIAELAHAMRAAMSSAHERVVQDLERRRMARVDALRGQAAEADGGARDQADQQIARIDRWVEVETQRIRLDGECVSRRAVESSRRGWPRAGPRWIVPSRSSMPQSPTTAPRSTPSWSRSPRNPTQRRSRGLSTVCRQSHRSAASTRNRLAPKDRRLKPAMRG